MMLRTPLLAWTLSLAWTEPRFGCPPLSHPPSSTFSHSSCFGSAGARARGRALHPHHWATTGDLSVMGLHWGTTERPLGRRWRVRARARVVGDHWSGGGEFIGPSGDPVTERAVAQSWPSLLEWRWPSGDRAYWSSGGELLEQPGCVCPHSSLGPHSEGHSDTAPTAPETVGAVSSIICSGQGDPHLPQHQPESTLLVRPEKTPDR